MELEDIVRWEVKDGDVLFVNADAIDTAVLRNLMTNKNVIILPVHCEPGVAVSSYVTVQTKEEVPQTL